MFLRKKEINNTYYWYLEETHREGKKVKKKLIKYLGKTENAYDFLKGKEEYNKLFNEISNFRDLYIENSKIDRNRIYCMNHLKRNQGIKLLPSNYVDSIVTDPPYEIEFMGKDGTGITFKPSFWKECYRVLKPGAYLLAFSGTRTYHKMASAIEKAGFEIRDKIDVFYDGNVDLQDFMNSLSEEQLTAFIRMIEQQGIEGFMSWIYGSGFPKSMDISKAIDKAAGVEREVISYYETHDIRSNGLMERKGILKVARTAAATELAKQWEGWGTALKPANEPIVVARKPLSEETVINNVLKWSTGGINIDGSRLPTNDYIGKVNSDDVINEYQSEGWRIKKMNTDGNHLGRFPANVIINDEYTENVLNDQSGMLKSGSNNVRRREGYFLEHGGLGKSGDLQISYGDCGGASRFFYCPKASQAEKEEYNTHLTVKPLKLIKYLVKLVTPKGGVSLDPFLGSGTHSVACIELSREGYTVDYIGFDKDRKSYEIAARRIHNKRDSL
ncbi:MAG: Modification methylase HindIII [Firmicutes bacterium ADurb.Bin419]|nr:MAG: Modification methylase HindIII [Firmicutes bacterium ADurb.Bin419]